MEKSPKYGYDSEGRPMNCQCDVVKNWLLTNAGAKISQKTCTDMFGFTRLAAIIFTLKNDYGMPIKSEELACITRYDTSSKPMFYWIEKSDVMDYRRKRHESKVQEVA